MKTVKERFEAKFEEDESGCWNWTASKRAGYGAFGIDGRTQRAHRVAYQLYVEEIPAGLCCLHRCDNRGCVNPDHLFLGTYTDNNRDCENKGRRPRIDTSGEKHGKAKLTEDDVRTIRTMYANGARQVDLARKFGVSQSAIYHIVHRCNWKNI